MTVALVCGGRGFHDVTAIRDALDTLPLTKVLCGDAPGADRIASMYAEKRSIPVQVFVADWLRYGNRAGPIRNSAMLNEGKPDIVVAFPGGRGTADTVRKARSMGIEVWEPVT